jgi:hypothetical protein
MCFAGMQPGILKAAKRPAKASFISSIDERLATSHVLLYDVDRKVRESAHASEFERQSLRIASHTEYTQNQVKDMVPAIGKLLARNDDIAAVLLPAIVTALEKVHSFLRTRACASMRAKTFGQKCQTACTGVHMFMYLTDVCTHICAYSGCMYPCACTLGTDYLVKR